MPGDIVGHGTVEEAKSCADAAITEACPRLALDEARYSGADGHNLTVRSIYRQHQVEQQTVTRSCFSSPAEAAYPAAQGADRAACTDTPSCS